MLADVFVNFRDICLEIICELDPAKLAPGLAWQAALKKTKANFDLLTDIDMLLMIEKGIRWEIYQYYISEYVIYQYLKATNKYIKYYDKDKESWYI